LPDNLHPYLFAVFVVVGTHGSCALSLGFRTNMVAKVLNCSLKARPDIVCLESRGTLVAKLKLNVLYVCIYVLYVRLYAVLYCYRLYRSLITTCVARVDPRPPLQTPHGASLSPTLAADTSYGPIDGH